MKKERPEFMTHILIKNIPDLTIRHLLFVVRTQGCPVSRCAYCTINTFIRCEEDYLLTEYIVKRSKELLEWVPQERLFDNAL